MDNQRNLILAVSISIVILLVFDYFYKDPKYNNVQVKVENIDSYSDSQEPRIENIEPTIQKEIKTKLGNNYVEDRIIFDMSSVKGSINLYGAIVDDLTLKKYFESIKADSNQVKILNKENSKKPYFVGNGWASNSKIKLPNKKSLWKADKKSYQSGDVINLEWDNKEGFVFKRKIEIDEKYLFTITDEVFNYSKEKVDLANFSYIQRRNHKPQNKFFILHEGPIGVFEENAQAGYKPKEISYDDLQEEGTIPINSQGGWIGLTDHYWQVAIFPEKKTDFEARFKYLKKPNNSVQLDYINNEVSSLKPNSSLIAKSYIFAGAKEVPLFDKYMNQLNVEKFDLSVDFGMFYFLTKPLFYALNYLALFFNNFGIGIIILTIFIRIIMFPLANKSFKSMNAMKLMTPEIKRLKERYKDDRTKMNQEMFALYKEKKINPAAGCLPILIQIPIFFALYKVLFVSIEMRHAPFFGWIKDLSAPDPTSIFNLFGLIPWSPPSFLIIGIWPIIMGLTMYLQQKLNPPPPDPIQAKIFLMLPFVFTFLLATFPSGMVIYWTCNNILSIAQQAYLLKKQKNEKTKSL